MIKPVNRYIVISLSDEKVEQKDSLIVLPEDYKPEKSRHAKVRVVSFADDVRFGLEKGCDLIVDRSMIEEINAGGTIYNVILDNYVIGIIE